MKKFFIKDFVFTTCFKVMTAEEKRVLSGFTQEERKKKEELVLQQFRSFIDSKKNKSWYLL